jgi:hypothetical protein
MPTFLKPYFDTEGPCGLPMKDKQAKSLETRLRDLPKDDAYAFRRCSFERGIAELSPEGRSDVSWITEETPDRAGDIVVARGMDDSHFQLNPIVTLNHAYDQPPVGRSLWRRRVKEGALVGVKAKTLYPARPADWPVEDWPPDIAFGLVQSGLLRGKSIGFFPLKLRTPAAEEIDRQPALKNVRYIIEEWLLAEYAGCYVPMPHAVVEQVSKALAVHGGADLQSARTGRIENPSYMPFTSLWEIDKALPGYLLAADLEAIIAGALERSWQKARGRV